MHQDRAVTDILFHYKAMYKFQRARGSLPHVKSPSFY